MMTKKPKKTYKTIVSLVLHTFRKQPKIKSKEMTSIVKKQFKTSKFDVYHYSWYKYQIKQGKYTLPEDIVAQM